MIRYRCHPWRPAVAILTVLALQACGGGGESSRSSDVDTANNADGLGVQGHLSGTQAIGLANPMGQTSMAPAYEAVTLRDDGTALATWRLNDVNDSQRSTLAWSQMDSRGNWSASQTLTQMNGRLSYQPFTLRTNAAGNAVLAWTKGPYYATNPQDIGQALVYSRATGWSATATGIAQGSSPKLPTYQEAPSWALDIQDDGTLLSTAFNESGQSGLLRVDASGQQTFTLADPASVSSTFAPFTTAADPTGLTFYFDNTARNAKVRLGTSTDPSRFAALPVQAGVSCHEYLRFAPIIAKASSSQAGIAAITLGDDVSPTHTCSTQRMFLTRVDTWPTFRISSVQANATHTALDFPPQIAIDAQGRALAIWCEGVLNNHFYTSNWQCKWSKSLPGEAWSKPQDLIPNLPQMGSYSGNSRPVLAMNANGDAVAAMKLAGTNLSTIDDRIVVAKFSFDQEWQPWFIAANKLGLSTPAVSINASGASLLTYSGFDLPRINGHAPTGFTYTDANAPLNRVYALRF